MSLTLSLIFWIKEKKKWYYHLLEIDTICKALSSTNTKKNIQRKWDRCLSSFPSVLHNENK